MIGFGCLAIGILMYLAPMNEIRGYGKYQGDEKELEGPKRIKSIIGIILMVYGSISWFLTIWSYIYKN